MKKDNRIQNKQSNKEPSSDNSGNWITIGLSIGPAIDVLRKNKKSEEQEDNDEKE